MPARPMLLVDEPGTRRLFTNDMRGPLYTIPRDGKTVVAVSRHQRRRSGTSMSTRPGNERGFQSFAFHPQFSRTGNARVRQVLHLHRYRQHARPVADFKPGGGTHTHDTVLLEWTAKNPAAAAYDGGAPRELMRFEQPFGNHNGGQLAFNPLAGAEQPGIRSPLHGIGRWRKRRRSDQPGPEPELGVRQDAAHRSARERTARTASTASRRTIPSSTITIRARSARSTRSGLRNPQRFAWDSRNGNLFVADIGQNIVEEVSQITKGANLGWNKWEGSFGFISRAGGQPRQPARRFEDDVSDRRVRPARSAPPAAVGRDDGRGVSAEGDSAACRIC